MTRTTTRPASPRPRLPALVGSLALLGALAPHAAAQPQDVLVLQAEGKADAATRARVHAKVLELARSTGAKVAPGDTTFGDAAAAVGCTPTAPACKDEVREMLGVDELVVATVTPKPGGYEVVVQRVGKGGAPREARATVTGEAGADLAALAPLFGGAAPATPPAQPPVQPPGTGAITTTPAEPALPPEYADATALPPASEPGASVVTTQPAPADRPLERGGSLRTRLPLVGMVGGGALVVVGFMLWGKASDLEDQIDAAPTATLADLQALADLESRGRSYAGWGNALFIGGAVAAGVGTYYFLKDRRARKDARATTARLTPTVHPHGAGLVLTFGGTP